jgi:hypothetical protein
MYNYAAYNSRISDFHLIDKKQAGLKVLIYINKEISIGSWKEVFHFSNVVTVTLRLAGETQVLNVYNVYNLPPISYNDEIGTVSIIALNDTLTMPRRHIIIEDFNLYHP